MGSTGSGKSVEMAWCAALDSGLLAGGEVEKRGGGFGRGEQEERREPERASLRSVALGAQPASLLRRQSPARASKGAKTRRCHERATLCAHGRRSRRAGQLHHAMRLACSSISLFIPSLTVPLGPRSRLTQNQTRVPLNPRKHLGLLDRPSPDIRKRLVADGSLLGGARNRPARLRDLLLELLDKRRLDRG